MKIQNQGFDHVEFVVNQIKPYADQYSRMGFEKIGSSEKDGNRSDVYAQGYIRIVLTETSSKTPAENLNLKFFKNHGEGVSVLGLDVDDAEAAYVELTKRGARSAMEPKRVETAQGTVTRAEIFTPSDLRFALISRKGQPRTGPALFDLHTQVSRMESPSPFNLRLIDHLTNNVGMGDTQTWVDFYQDIFQFEIVRHFDISTGRTGLTSEVVQSPCGKIKVPINEATEPESQVQEFYNRFHGVGVQHLAFLTTDIIPTLNALRDARLFKFLEVPHTYYEAVPKRVADFSENIQELERLGILLDGEGSGYLLQIFTGEVMGPFFFEFIQRKGNNGFGEGNFTALFEAIERDQVRRGVLN